MISNGSPFHKSSSGWHLIAAFDWQKRDVSHAPTEQNGWKPAIAFMKRLWKKVRNHLCLIKSQYSILTTPQGYNKEMKSFIQSYEANTVLDSSILLAPLVFFISPSDPRFTSTLDRIMLPPEEGGLTSTGLVYRYDTDASDDGKSWANIEIESSMKLIIKFFLQRCWRKGWSLLDLYVLAS